MGKLTGLPLKLRLIAAFKSAWVVNPHFVQENRA